MKHPDLQFLGNQDLLPDQAERARSIESICLQPPPDGVQLFFEFIEKPQTGKSIVTRRYAEFHFEQLHQLRVEQPGAIYRAISEHLVPLTAHYGRLDLAEAMTEMLPNPTWKANALRKLVEAGRGDYLGDYIREARRADPSHDMHGAFRSVAPIDYNDRNALVRDIYELALFVGSDSTASEVAGAIPEADRLKLQASADRRRRSPESRHIERLKLIDEGHIQ